MKRLCGKARQNRSEAASLIQRSAYLRVFGGAGLTLKQALSLFELNTLGLGFVISSLFTTRVGMWRIIPNSLSIALKDYQHMVGGAGSLFGAAYYILIAAATCAMSTLHNSKAWPLPRFISSLGVILTVGGQMVRHGLAVRPAH